MPLAVEGTSSFVTLKYATAVGAEEAYGSLSYKTSSKHCQDTYL